MTENKLNVVISFGKFKGKRLSEVPRGYLDWMADEMVWHGKEIDYPRLAQQFRAEFNHSHRNRNTQAQSVLPETYRKSDVCGKAIDDLTYFIMKDIGLLTFYHSDCLLK